MANLDAGATALFLEGTGLSMIVSKIFSYGMALAVAAMLVVTAIGSAGALLQG